MNYLEGSKMRSYFDKLSPKNAKKVRRIANSGANFLSGTVSPAKSNPETNDIECLEMALEHYRKRGVNNLVMQPKYMGSRCQVYLFPNDPEKCYAISRNGYRIRFLDLEHIFKERLEFWSNYIHESDLIIEDGELLPWSAMGKGLIDNSFVKFSDLYKRNFELLRQFGWDGEDYERNDREISVFDRQMELFGQDGDIEFMPFNILKKGDLICMDENQANYDFIGKHSQLMINLLKKDQTYIYDYLKTIEEQELEGVVIKPAQYDPEAKCAPYLKLRNKNYLSIVYGPDYQREDKLKELVRKKAVGKKIHASVKEYEIGRRLLSIPIESIHPKNNNYMEMIAEALYNFQLDEKLDPRL